MTNTTATTVNCLTIGNINNAIFNGKLDTTGRTGLDIEFLDTHETTHAINFITSKYGEGNNNKELVVKAFIDWCHMIGGETVEQAERRAQGYINICFDIANN